MESTIFHGQKIQLVSGDSIKQMGQSATQIYFLFHFCFCWVLSWIGIQFGWLAGVQSWMCFFFTFGRVWWYVFFLNDFSRLHPTSTRDCGTLGHPCFQTKPFNQLYTALINPEVPGSKAWWCCVVASTSFWVHLWTTPPQPAKSVGYGLLGFPQQDSAGTPSEAPRIPRRAVPRIMVSRACSDCWLLPRTIRSAGRWVPLKPVWPLLAERSAGPPRMIGLFQ